MHIIINKDKDAIKHFFHYDFYPLLVVAAIAWLTPIILSVFKLKKFPIVIIEVTLGLRLEFIAAALPLF